MIMDIATQEKWNQVYANQQHGFFPPAMILQMYSHLLPAQGTALDLACGLGRNAIHLSRNGLTTTAWDISSEAIQQLNEYVQKEGLTITADVRDLQSEPVPADSFDIIVVSHYLDRSLVNDIINALKAGGLLFYQTFTKLKVADVGPKNPDYLLDKGELLDLFSGLELIFYSDNRDLGDINIGIRNEAMLVAQKP